MRMSPGFLGLLLLCITLASPIARGEQITDMAGRQVTLPDPVRRIYAMSHSLAIVTALAPDLLVGLPYPFKRNPEADKFLPARYADLPQLDGGLEQLKAAEADFALGWTTPSFVRDRVGQFDKIALPAVLVDVDRLDQYPATFRFLGRVLHRQDRAEALASALEEMAGRVDALAATIPPGQKLRVYYAESIDGLTTQCDGSDRSDVIRRAGAINAMHCTNPTTQADNMPIDLETLLSIDPDVIVTRFPQTAKTVMADPRWRQLRAVREGRVYAVPTLPFNWFDRPPSYMRALGMRWLQRTLYPDRASFDLADETRRFYQLFLAVSPSEADLDQILMRR